VVLGLRVSEKILNFTRFLKLIKQHEHRTRQAVGLNDLKSLNQDTLCDVAIRPNLIYKYDLIAIYQLTECCCFSAISLALFANFRILKFVQIIILSLCR